MLKQSIIHEVERRLEGKHHLKPLYTSVYNIPERINDYDSSFFVVFNAKNQKYEIHCLEYPDLTHTLTLPFEQLDARALHHLWQNDIRVHGKEIFKRIEESQVRKDLEEKRQFKKWVEDVAEETKPLLAKSAWT